MFKDIGLTGLVSHDYPLGANSAPCMSASAPKPLTSSACFAIMSLFRLALNRLFFGSQLDAADASFA